MWLWRMRENETIGAVFNDEINRVLLVIGFSCRYISVHRRILRRFHHQISAGACVFIRAPCRTLRVLASTHHAPVKVPAA